MAEQNRKNLYDELVRSAALVGDEYRVLRQQLDSLNEMQTRAVLDLVKHVAGSDFLVKRVRTQEVAHAQR